MQSRFVNRMDKRGARKELKANSFVSGNPARTHLARKKQVAVINRLPDILKRIISLEKRLGKINES